MFKSIIDGNLTIISVLLCMLVSILLGFLVSLIHSKCNKTSKNFMTTLVLLPLIVQVVIMMTSGNLGTSVAILGAFSLIRFRSAPGNSRELLSIFLSMAIGLACGIGHIYFAITFSIIACILIYLLTKLNYGNKLEFKNLKVVIPEDLDYENIFDDIFTKYTNSCLLIKSKTINMGSLYELDYEVSLKNDISEKKFIDELRVRNGNLKIVLSHMIEGTEL